MSVPPKKTKIQEFENTKGILAEKKVKILLKTEKRMWMVFSNFYTFKDVTEILKYF